MKLLVPSLFPVLIAAALASHAGAQEATGSRFNERQLETLTKKIDEQNTKIDALSQQILKLEQQISNMRPGVMIGESTPSPSSAASAPAAAPSSSAPPSGNAHIVAKGETLTSIAKTYKVGVQELQRFNHIENDRALQIGQTIMIPGASPAPTPASPNQ